MESIVHKLSQKISPWVNSREDEIIIRGKWKREITITRDKQAGKPDPPRAGVDTMGGNSD